MDPIMEALRGLTSGAGSRGALTPPLPDLDESGLSQTDVDTEIDRVLVGTRFTGPDQIRLLVSEILDVGSALGLTPDQTLWFGKAARLGVEYTPEQTLFIRRFYVERDVYRRYWKQCEKEEMLGGVDDGVDDGTGAHE